MRAAGAAPAASPTAPTHFKLSGIVSGRGRCGTIVDVSGDPLDEALDEIGSRLDADIQTLIAALKADESVEDAWEALLQEDLNEA